MSVQLPPYPIDNPEQNVPEQKQLRGYRAVTGLGVASMALGVLSVLAVLDWVWGLVPLAAIITGWIALRAIRRCPEEITGAGFAKSGLAMGAGFWVIGLTWLTYVYYTQAPPGYTPASYADLQLPPGSPPEMLVPPKAEELDGQRVYIRGYMVPGRQQSGMKQFFLSDDPGVCSFCAPKPKKTQLIEVKLINDIEAEYTTHAIGVGGKLRVDTGLPNKKKPKEEPNVRKANPLEKSGEPTPEKPAGGVYYQLEADFLR